jgi:5-formyltetrahydrofolate cyclo-ligase
LRRELRAKRRALPGEIRAAADRAIQTNIRRLPVFRRAQRIALFLAFDGEPSLAPLIDAARRQGKRLYVPVLRGMTMAFAELEPGGTLAANFFGIMEPKLGAKLDARKLDLVLTPLVAFDDRGVRVGVGRGYYDRCFRFLRHRSQWRRPKLLGVAYELQRVPPLVPNSWDVPLWGVVTEAGVRHF